MPFVCDGHLCVEEVNRVCFMIRDLIVSFNRISDICLMHLWYFCFLKSE